MRRYDVVSGILFILSIIDFALAAPVLVQEKRQACVDVVHIPKDVIIVLGKRGDEELEKLAEEYFKTWGKPVASSDAHVSSSSAPLGPDHGSTNAVQAPAPNPASPTANPDPLMEPSSPSSTTPMQGDDELHEPLHTLASTEYDSDHELMGAHAPEPNPKKRPLTDPDPDFDWDYWTNLLNPPRVKRPHVSTDVVHPPAPNPASSTANPDPLMKPSGPSSIAPIQGDDDLHELLHKIGSKEYASDHELTWAHAPQPNPKEGPSTGPDPNFDWDDWMNLEDTQPPKLGSSKESGLTREKQVEHAQKPNPGLSKDPDSEWISLDDLPPPRLALPEEFGHESGHEYVTVDRVDHGQQSNPGPSTKPEHEVVTAPLPNLGSPKVSDSEPEDREVVARPPPSSDPEVHLDHQSSSEDSQPEDPQAAVDAARYAAKGKAKVERRISGTARDVGNAAQKELQPVERSLDPRDLTVMNPGNL